MKRLRAVVLAFAATLTLSMFALPVFASSFSTDSWGCGWSGGSAGGGLTNYSWTSAAAWCSLGAGVQVDYYFQGSWHSAPWRWASTYVQDNQFGSLSATHQIYVSGYGYGQLEYSYY